MPVRASIATDLTKQEQEHVRAALRGLCLRVGNQRQTIIALGIDVRTLRSVLNGGHVTASVAFRLARLLQASIGELVTGRYVPPGPCPYCGRGP